MKGVCYSHHGLAVYVKEGLSFARYLSLENSVDSYLCFQLALLHSVSCFFFLYLSLSSSLCSVFDAISSDIDEVLSINPSANVFVFGNFNAHHKDWLTNSGGIGRPDELLQFFYLKIILPRWLTFLFIFLTVTLTALLIWISFFLLMLAFVLQWLSFYWEILILWLSQFPLTFYQNQNEIPRFIT